MSITVYNPAKASKEIGVTPNTVRLWCKSFADFLTPDANPPVGQERRLSQSDVAILQLVKECRDQELSIDSIRLKLSQTDLLSISKPFIDVEIVPTSPISSVPVQPVDISSLVGLLEGLHRKIDALPTQTPVQPSNQSVQSEIVRLRFIVFLLSIGLLIVAAGLGYLLVR